MEMGPHLLPLLLTLVVSSHAEVLASRHAGGRQLVPSDHQSGRHLEPRQVVSVVHRNLGQVQDNVAEETLFRHEVAKIRPEDKDQDGKVSSHKTAGLNSEKQFNTLQPVPISVPVLLQAPNKNYFLPPHGTRISVKNQVPSVFSNNGQTFSLSNSAPSVSSTYGTPDVNSPLAGHSSYYGGQTHQHNVPISSVSIIDDVSAISSSYGTPGVSHSGVASSYDQPPHVDHSISTVSDPISSLSHLSSGSNYQGNHGGDGSHTVQSSSYGPVPHILEHSVSSSPVSISVPEVGVSGLYHTPNDNHISSISISNSIPSISGLYGTPDASVPHNGQSTSSFGQPTFSENPISFISNPSSGISSLYGTPIGVSSVTISDPSPSVSGQNGIPGASISNNELISSYSEVPFSGNPVSHVSVINAIPAAPSEYKSSNAGISQYGFPSFNHPQTSSYADPHIGNIVTTPSRSYLPPDTGASGSVISSVSLSIEGNKGLQLAAPLNGHSSLPSLRLGPPHINLLPSVHNTPSYAPAFPLGADISAKSARGPSQPAKSQYHSQDELGQYAFGYKTGESSRDETRDVYGHVRGSYSYVDANGEVQTQNYIADDKGFRVTGTNLPVHVTDKN
ncbi:uncharacterized protein [Palaemon carinicauda]|uniref:uncharacterized protein n=1 Tax=Palaemon carinicauda TaxID=392227 RepID=UPI0035B5C2CD